MACVVVLWWPVYGGILGSHDEADHLPRGPTIQCVALPYCLRLCSVDGAGSEEGYACVLNVCGAGCRARQHSAQLRVTGARSAPVSVNVLSRHQARDHQVKMSLPWNAVHAEHAGLQLANAQVTWSECTTRNCKATIRTVIGQAPAAGWLRSRPPSSRRRETQHSKNSDISQQPHCTRKR